MATTLNRDLLYEVAEKLVFAEMEGLNSGGGSSVMNFMMLSRGCKQALLSQFSRVKKFELVCSNGDRTRAGHFRRGYKNDWQYYGYYKRDKWLIAMLIQTGKFNPKEIQLLHVFEEGMGNCGKVAEVVMPKGIKPMECLSLLFALDVGGLSVPAGGPSLLLDKLDISDAVCSMVHFDKFLCLNPKELKLVIETKEFCCSPTTNYAAVCSERIGAIEIEYRSSCDDFCNDYEPFQEFPTSDWIKLFSYIFASSPNLKKFHVRISFQGGSTSLLMSLLYKTMTAMNDEVLPSVLRDGCFVRIELQCSLLRPELEALQHHNQVGLLEMGAPKPLEDGLEVCRVISFGERAELSFSIYCEEMSGSMDYTPPSFGDEDYGSDFSDY